MQIINGDCLDELARLPDASVHAVVTDPPYGLGNTSPENVAACLRAWLDGERHDASGGGFMGREWDAWVPGPEVWRECLRVLKPGGHVLAFAGTRTVDLMALALRLAGFEIRDALAWHYGSGFSKSWNFSTMYRGEWCSCGGNALPCDHEKTTKHDVRLVRGADLSPPVDHETERGQVLLPGVSQQGAPEQRAEAIGGSVRAGQPELGGRLVHRTGEGLPHGSVSARPRTDGEAERLCAGAPVGDGSSRRPATQARGGGAPQRPRPAQQRPVEPDAVREPSGALGGKPPKGRALCPSCGGLIEFYRGAGTGLKPSWEPIILARKPLAGTVAANVLEHGAGALNVDGCRVEARARPAIESRAGPSCAVFGDGINGSRAAGSTDLGRWPPNAVLVHPPYCDGDRNGRGCVEGCPVGEMGRQSGELTSGNRAAGNYGLVGCMGGGVSPMPTVVGDTGTAARFFYQAKASRAEREAGVRCGSRAVADITGRKPDSAGLKNPASGVGRMPRRNHHPTVKPVDLMRWLVRLVTSPGGTVLDPFAGSGTTGCACAVEGFEFVGIEREPEYADIARQRVAWWSEHGERAVEAQAARDAADAEDAATGQTRLFDW